MRNFAKKIGELGLVLAIVVIMVIMVGCEPPTGDSNSLQVVLEKDNAANFEFKGHALELEYEKKATLDRFSIRIKVWDESGDQAYSGMPTFREGESKNLGGFSFKLLGGNTSSVTIEIAE